MENTDFAWEGFIGGEWQEKIDPAEFIHLNYTPYDGDESFLAGVAHSADGRDDVAELLKYTLCIGLDC